MKWFGQSWGAPACEPEDHAATPVGEPCSYCSEPIDETDQGVLMPHVGLTEVTIRPWHLDCFLRSIGVGLATTRVLGALQRAAAIQRFKQGKARS